MSSHWTEAKIFKFLRLYKRYECLWNPYSPDYGNCHAKSEAFSQILYEMNVLGLTVNECLNQIKYVRETYKQEQRRLENLTLLGGRGYSKLLWYPLMNSMLSKVVEDEDKLNQATDHSDLRLVLVPKRLPLDAGDQGNQRDLNPSGYGQGTVSWNHNETTVCPYLPYSNFRDHVDFHQNHNILSNCIVRCERNDHHISPCPTCGYSSSSSCGCFSMNNIGYHSNNIGKNYSTQSQVNYRPRTSYNYRNGMLEINSAVRIPVSTQQSPCTYGSVIESVTPEEPEYSFNPISSNNYQPEIQTVEDKEELSTECCQNPSYDNDKQNKVSFECKSPDFAANKNSHSSNLGSKATGAVIENDNWHLKRAEEGKGNVNEILCTQNLLGFISIAQDAICQNTEHERSGPDNNKAAPQAIDVKNHTNNTQFSLRVDPKNSVDIKREIATLAQQQSDANMKADIKVEDITTVTLEREQQTNDNIPITISRVKQQLREENFQTNCNSESRGSGKRTKICMLNENLIDVISSSNRKTSALKTTQDLIRESKSIIKHNLTKLVIDFIDETLNNSNRRSTVNTEERIILKKVAKDMNKALGNKNKRTRDGKLAMGNSEHSQRNHGMKFCNKTICWREPIEESLNIVPCNSIRSPTNKTNCKQNQCTGNHFRMMAGADIDIDNDIVQSNLFGQKDIPPRNKTTSIDDCTFGNDKQTSCEDITLPNYRQYSLVSTDEKQECNSENDGQTNPEDYASAEIRSTQVAGEIELSDSKSKVVENEKLEVLSTNKISDHEHPVVIDKLVDDVNNPLSTVQDTRISNSLTIHISVETCESTKSEIIDKAVNKITRILRTTLDKNGFMIEKEEFFAKKNLITNNDGEIHRKLIENETVWKTELKNIISNLIKQKKAGDPITFKVKTMILPVTNQPNNVTAEGARNFTLPAKRRWNFGKTKKRAFRTSETGGNSEMKTARSEISQDMDELFWKNVEKLYDKGKKEHIKMIHNSGFDFESNRMAQADDSRNITKKEKNYTMLSQKMHDETEHRSMLYNEEFTDLDSDVLLRKSKQFMSKKQFLKNQTRKPRHRSIISRNILKNITDLDKILFDHDVKGLVSLNNDYPHALSKLLKYLVQFGNKYQRTPKKIGKPLRNALQENEFTKNNKKFEQNYQQNDSVVASFCDTLPRGLNGDIDVYLCTEISQEDQLLMQKPTDCNSSPEKNVNNIVNQNSPSSSAAMQTDSKRTNNTSSAQNSYNIIDTIPSNYQCISQNELRSFEEGSKVSLSCAGFEEEESSIHQILTRSESEEGESLLEAKLRAAAENQIRYCCTGGKMHSVCTPICDVTSRLRLCAIIKSTNKISAANSDIPSNNTCCCDDLDKSSNADTAYSEPRMKPNQNNVGIGDASVRLVTESCQTDPLKTDSNLLETQGRESKPDCTEDLKSSFEAVNSEAYRKNSTAVNRTIIPTNEKIKHPDDVNTSKPITIQRPTVQSNAQNSVSASLHVPDLEGGSLILEIKIPQPLFSIELKKGCKEPEKTGTSIKQHSCELLEQSYQNVAISLNEESAIKSSSKNSVTPREEHNMNYNQETTSNNLVNCRGRKVGVKKIREALPFGIPRSQFCDMESDWKKKNPVCSHDSKSSTSKAFNSIKENEGKEDCSDSGQCNLILETLQKCELKVQNDSENNITRQLSSTKSIKCQISCESQSVVTANSLSNHKEVFLDNQISTKGNRAMLPPAGKCYYRKTQESPLPGGREWTGSESLFPKTASKFHMQKIEDPKNCASKETRVISKNKPSELQKKSCMISSFNYSSNEISSNSDQELENDNHICDQNINDLSNMTLELKNVENPESSQYHCYYAESTAVDVNTFVSRVASQLRGLSTEAALRSQQRIQTLISNSRLEWEKKKRHH